MSCAMIRYNSYSECLVYNRNTSHLILFQQIEFAFLDVDHIDITTLSWLSQAYFGIHKHSPDAILDVVEVLLNTTHSRFTKVNTSTFLLQHYVNLCLTFPNSTPHKYTLTPIVNVLHQYAHAANLHGGETQKCESRMILISLAIAVWIYWQNLNRNITNCSISYSIMPHTHGSSMPTAKSRWLRTWPKSQSTGLVTVFDAFCAAEGIHMDSLIQVE